MTEREDREFRWDACKGCGRAIIWALNLSGKGGPIPLDATAPVYRLSMKGGRPVAVRDELAKVSHFVTCPKRDEFSRKGKP